MRIPVAIASPLRSAISFGSRCRRSCPAPWPGKSGLRPGPAPWSVSSIAPGPPPAGTITPVDGRYPVPSPPRLRELHVNISTRCNLRCVMCGQDHRSRTVLKYRKIFRAVDWSAGPRPDPSGRRAAGGAGGLQTGPAGRERHEIIDHPDYQRHGHDRGLARGAALRGPRMPVFVERRFGPKPMKPSISGLPGPRSWPDFGDWPPNGNEGGPGCTSPSA